ncbi:MAG: porin family protein [Clostridium sp.]|nr:porin family protein [Clostridium sp.]
MKKILLVAMFVMAAVCCKAQFFAGGTLGVATQKSGDAPRLTTFAIVPTAGFNFSESFSAGVELGYDYAEQDNSTVNNFMVGLFGRLNFYRHDNFSIFGEAAVDYLRYKEDHVPGMGGIGIFVRPGISYMLSDNWQILAKSNLFSYSHYSLDGEGFNNTGFAINLTNIQLGIVYNF